MAISIDVECVLKGRSERFGNVRWWRVFTPLTFPLSNALVGLSRMNSPSTTGTKGQVCMKLADPMVLSASKISEASALRRQSNPLLGLDALQL